MIINSTLRHLILFTIKPKQGQINYFNGTSVFDILRSRFYTKEHSNQMH